MARGYSGQLPHLDSLLEIEELEEELLELKKRKKAVSQSEDGLEEGS